MAREKKETKRKRKRIPVDVCNFIENLERLLELRFSSNHAENNAYSLGSHSSPLTSTQIVTNSLNDPVMNVAYDTQETPVTTDDAPFMGLPAMDLLAVGLETVDTATLRQSIDPIWKSLEVLDAVAMLDLKRVDKGARVTNGYVPYAHGQHCVRIRLTDISLSFFQCLCQTDSRGSDTHSPAKGIDRSIRPRVGSSR
jgi:hypothetical protein